MPPGFEETDKAGWYYNRADKIFWVRSTRQLLWFDEESGEHKELYEGQILPLAFGGGAATSSEATGAAGATGAKHYRPDDLSEKKAMKKPSSGQTFLRGGVNCQNREPVKEDGAVARRQTCSHAGRLRRR